MQLYHSLYLFRKNSNVQKTWTLLKNSWITHKFFYIHHKKSIISLWSKSSNFYGAGRKCVGFKVTDALYTCTYYSSTISPGVKPGDWFTCSAPLTCVQVSGSYSAVLIQLPLRCFLLPESGWHQWESCLQQEQLNKNFKTGPVFGLLFLKNLLRLVITKWRCSFSRHWIA